MIRTWRFLVGVAVCVLFAVTGEAQSTRATITGRVVDPTSSVVPGATLAAINAVTGVKYTTTSNESGNYFLRELPEGRYEFSVEAAGFRRYLLRDVGLAIAQTLTLDVSLALGQVDQVVEVSAQAVALQTTTTDVGTAITQERVVDLPLSVSGNIRNPESFITLVPGVTGTPGSVRANGSQTNAGEIMYDGIGATGLEVPGRTISGPSVESLSEFKMVTSGFSAEYGHTAAGFEIFVSRSGTNNYHGAAFEYLRNDALDARGFFQPTASINRQNEYGVSGGGPVRIPKVYDGRNKTFFFFVFSGFRYRRGASNSWLSLPPMDFRGGDFSKLGKTIYNPFSTRSDGKGGFTRDPFEGNRIAPALFSPVSANMVPLIGPTTNSDLLNNYLNVGKSTTDRDLYSIKLDHAFSERQRISGFFYWGSRLDIGGDNIPQPLSSAMTNTRPSYWPRINYDFIVSPSSLNHFTFGFTYDDNIWRSKNADQGWPTKLGLTGVETGATNKPPVVNFTDGYTSLSSEIKTVGNQRNYSYQANDTFSKMYGKHSFKIGGDVRLARQDGADRFSSQGNFSFSNFGTSMPTAAGRGNWGMPSPASCWARSTRRK